VRPADLAERLRAGFPDLLLARDEVTIVDDISTGKRENVEQALAGGARLVEADIRDGQGLIDLFEEVRPDAVFHLAAQIDVRRSVAEIAPRSTEKPGDRELKMAALLVESMSGPFEPARYEDGYRKRLLELIASRNGQAVAAPDPAEPVVTSGVEELMAALEASVKQVRSTSRKRRAV